MRTIEECKAEILNGIHDCAMRICETASLTTTQEYANTIDKLTSSLERLSVVEYHSKTDGVTISKDDFQKVIANAVNDTIMREIIENNSDIYGLLTDFGAIIANLIFESEEKYKWEF